MWVWVFGGGRHRGFLFGFFFPWKRRKRSLTRADVLVLFQVICQDFFNRCQPCPQSVEIFCQILSVVLMRVVKFHSKSDFTPVVTQFSDNRKGKSLYKAHKLAWEPQDAGLFFTTLFSSRIFFFTFASMTAKF